MRRGVYVWILAAAAAVCVALHVIEASSVVFFSAALAFPFEQIGLGLRALSLSGAAGNVAALALYTAICCLPAAMLILIRKKRPLCSEDALLALLSAALFAALYLMINPGFMMKQGAAGLTVEKAILGGALYSILGGYLILRVLRLFFAGSTQKLMSYLSIMLRLVGVLFVCVIFGVCISHFLDSIAALRSGNAGNEHQLGTTYFFLGLQLIVDALPYAMNLLIVHAGLRLLSEMLCQSYSQSAVAAAERLSKLCRAALTATILSNIAFNLLQLLFAGSLMVVNGSLQIPVFSIAFVLAVLLLTRFIAQIKRLKDDNDLFV